MKRLSVIFALLLGASQVFGQEQGFKNVQILKDLTPAQLFTEMDLMEASLGVGCDYCHVAKGNETDFASDAKSEKKTGREMIQLVLDTNQKFFNKRPVVTCNTCHRGSTNPVGLVSLPQAMPPFPTPERKRPILPTRDEIVAKYEAAVGKIDKNALASLSMKGIREGSDGKKTDIEVWQKDGNVRGSTADMTEVVTPNGGWLSTKQEGTKAMSAEQHEASVEHARDLRFVTPEDVPADARVVRTDKIEGHEVYVVQSSIAPKVRQRLYFDTESGLLVRRTLLTSTLLGDVPTQVDYSDYRDAGGFKLPYTMKLDLIAPWNNSTRHYTEIHPNAKVDEKTFEMPKP